MAKDEAERRVRAAVRDARSNDDRVEDFYWEEPAMHSPLDEETLDERASTQMGDMYESIRRGADE